MRTHRSILAPEIMEMASKPGSTLNLDSDKFRCFNHRDELDNTVFLPKFRLVTLLQSRAGQSLVAVMRAIYSARLALFIHGIT